MGIYLGTSKRNIYSSNSFCRIASKPVLKSIAITPPPIKTEYKYGEVFDSAGMVVVATYTNGKTKVIDGYTILNGEQLSVDMTSITIYYTEDEVTKTTIQDIYVKPIVVSIPSINVNPVYTGSSITATWSGYDSSLMDVSGNTSGVNAGSYTAIFSLKDKVNYTWSDGTTADKSVTWSIRKAQASITLDKTSVVLNGDKLSETVVISSVGMASIMAMSSDMSVATVSLNGNVLTISSVNETSGEATVALSGEVDSNYNVPEYPSVEVSAEFAPPMVTVKLTGSYSGNHYGGAYARALINELYYMPIPFGNATAQDNFVGFYPEAVLALPIGTEIEIKVGGSSSGASRNKITLNGADVGDTVSAAKVYNYTVTGNVHIHLESYDNKEIGPSMYASYGVITITEQ